MFYTLHLKSGEEFGIRSTQSFEQLCEYIKSSEKYVEFVQDDNYGNYVMVDVNQISSFSGNNA